MSLHAEIESSSRIVSKWVHTFTLLVVVLAELLSISSVVDSIRSLHESTFVYGWLYLSKRTTKWIVWARQICSMHNVHCAVNEYLFKEQSIVCRQSCSTSACRVENEKWTEPNIISPFIFNWIFFSSFSLFVFRQIPLHIIKSIEYRAVNINTHTKRRS